MKYGNIDSPNIIDTTCELVHDKLIDDYTKLLLHCDGADAATSTVDSAKNATVTFNGTAQLDTAQSKFGGASLLLDGNSDYLSLADSDNWTFGNADFTIDFWVRWNAFPTPDDAMSVMSQRVDGSNVWNLQFGVYGDGHQWYLWFYNGGLCTGRYKQTTRVTYNTGQWYHIAWVRSGPSAKLFVDGVSIAVTEESAFGNIGNVAAGLEIGRYGAGTEYLNGWLDEVRISKGIARWSSNFTPPTQSYDCPLDTQTKLLIHGGGANNATTFYDNSTTARTLTTVGNTKYDTTYYKHRVSSIKFSGNGDYISAADSADWDITTSTFYTIEFWVKLLDTTGNQYVVAQGVDASNHWYFGILNTAPTFRVNTTAGGQEINCQDTTGFNDNNWHHLAIVKDNTTWRMFTDGVQTGTSTESSTRTFAAGLTVGTLFAGHASYVKGYIDELRISPGIARWTSSFTRPAAPYDSPLNQYVIDGLDGDTDKEYRIIAFTNNGDPSSGQSVRLNFNTDSTDANYGWQAVYGNNLSAAASRSTASPLNLSGFTSAEGLCLTDTVLYTKTGKVRTGILKETIRISGTTVTQVGIYGSSWNNTVDNITSIWARGSGTNNVMGVGTRLILMKKRQLTSGTKTGEIDPAGFSSARTYGHWQLVYDNTITAAKTNLLLSSEMDSYTKLLIHADGADAATAFYDFSNSAHVITANGTAQVDTEQNKFGGASLLLDGNSDYLSAPDSDDWNFGTGNFTIDFWMRPTDLTSSQGLIFQGDQTGTSYWGCVFGFTDGEITFWAENGASTISITTSSSGISIGNWHHIAVVRSGNDWNIFVNGVSKVSATVSVTIGDFATSLLIGAVYRPGVDWYYNGWLDEIRISKGIARWTAAFTPPARAYNELDGDRDVVYNLKIRGINNYAGNQTFAIRYNYDASANYGYQHMNGQGSSATAGRGTSAGQFYGTYCNSQNQIGVSENLMYAKSGFVRPVITGDLRSITGTTVNDVLLIGAVWNNATSKVSAISVSGEASGLGIGTHVELWRLNL